VEVDGRLRTEDRRARARDRVELGQLLFVAVVLSLARAPTLLRLAPPAWWPQAAAYGIGTVAMFWVIERVAAF
jgi:hypothetical protein